MSKSTKHLKGKRIMYKGEQVLILPCVEPEDMFKPKVKKGSIYMANKKKKS